MLHWPLVCYSIYRAAPIGIRNFRMKTKQNIWTKQTPHGVWLSIFSTGGPEIWPRCPETSSIIKIDDLFSPWGHKKQHRTMSTGQTFSLCLQQELIRWHTMWSFKSVNKRPNEAGLTDRTGGHCLHSTHNRFGAARWASRKRNRRASKRSRGAVFTEPLLIFRHAPHTHSLDPFQNTQISPFSYSKADFD